MHDQAKEARLPQKIAVGWAIGEIGVAAYIGITMSYMLYYLTEAQESVRRWRGMRPC